MRAAALAVASLALALGACKARPSGGVVDSTGFRLLPASPDLVVHLDLARARTWPLFDTAVALATADAAGLLANVKETCGLDLVRELTSLTLVKQGELPAGTLGVVAHGLPHAKVTACLSAFAARGAGAQVTVDGSLVQLGLDGATIASAALLGTDTLVVVSRGGAGVEPAAWKAEVAATGPAPAWAADLHPRDPLAIRSVSPQRTILASAELADPLILHGTLSAPTAEAAKGDLARARAILAYLAQAGAGTGRLEPQGAMVYADYAAKGPEALALLQIAIPALSNGGAPPATPPTPTAPSVTLDPAAPAPTCDALGPAVATYIAQNLANMDATRRAAMEATMTALRPKLQAAYLEACRTGAWAAEPIACHVTYAGELQKFERCRLTLAEDKRAAFDKAVAAALGQ